MSPNDGLKRYFEAALAMTQITRARAEEVVRDLIRAGEVESGRAQDWVEDLVRGSRQRSEAFIGTVRSEVRRQLGDLGLTDLNDIARRVSEILNKAEGAARRASGRGRPAKKTAAKKAPAKKAAPRKAAAKKAPAKKAPAKKAAPRKAAAKKAPAKKTTAKRASTTKKAAARSTRR